MMSSVLAILVALSILSGGEADCQCPADDWTLMEGVGCFKYFETGKKFMEAEEACNSLSETPGKIIHLASIHSDDEFYALRDLIPQLGPTRHYVFIGLHMKEGLTSAWTDGSYYDYEKWCPLVFEDPIPPLQEAYGALTGGFECLGSWFEMAHFIPFSLPYICKSPCL